MTKLAIVRIEDGAVLQTFNEGTPRVDVPEMSVQIHSPVAGWEGAGKLVTREGPPRLRIVSVVEAVIPEGKQPIGEITRTYDDASKTVVENVAIEDIPPPLPEPTRSEKMARLLADYGLSRDDLKAELAIEPIAKV
jgi:hypothetical protein